MVESQHSVLLDVSVVQQVFDVQQDFDNSSLLARTKMSVIGIIFFKVTPFLLDLVQ